MRLSNLIADAALAVGSAILALACASTCIGHQHPLAIALAAAVIAAAIVAIVSLAIEVSAFIKALARGGDCR